MRQHVAAHRALRAATMACLLVGASTTTGCGVKNIFSAEETTQTVAIQVQSQSAAPVANVVVTAWIIDVDLPADARIPIEVGTAPVNARGEVRFSHAAVNPPYVCGWEVWAPGGDTPLATYPPVATDNLSPNGVAVVQLP